LPSSYRIIIATPVILAVTRDHRRNAGELLVVDDGFHAGIETLEALAGEADRFGLGFGNVDVTRLRRTEADAQEREGERRSSEVPHSEIPHEVAGQNNLSRAVPALHDRSLPCPRLSSAA
jgi:hypothetical protein